MNQRGIFLTAAVVALLSVACTQNAPVPATPTGGGPVPNPTLPAGLGGAPAGNTPAERGKSLITSKGCIACHTIKDVPGAVGTTGPALDGMGDPAKHPRIAGVLDNNPANLRRWLQNPPGVKAGTAMPNLNLSPSELDNLIAFIGTLK